MAPFEAHDTCFTVFEQAPQATAAAAPRTATTALSISPTRASSDQPVTPATIPTPGIASTSHFDFTQLSSSSKNSHPAVAQLSRPQARAFVPPATHSDVRGVFHDGRYYGQSHWLNYTQSSAEVAAAIASLEASQYDAARPTLARCKAMVKAAQIRDLTLMHPDGSLADMIPDRIVCDSLIRAYLHTFHTIYAIIDVASFSRAYRELWLDPSLGGDLFRVTLLLVLAIGSACVPQEASVNRATILQWFSAASGWCQASNLQLELEMDVIAIQYLYLAACRVHSIKPSHPWAEAHGIIHKAMRLGLHIDPKKRPAPEQLSPDQVQYHRKIWAAILELALQDSMESGTPPSTTPTSYNYELPANMDDTDIDQINSSHENKHPPQITDQLTSSSFPILLMQMASIRLKIAAYVNNFEANMSYEEMLKLHAEFATVLKSCTLEIHRYGATNTFQSKMFDVLVQRFVLALHHPFAARAATNPEFYFSRKMCFEASLVLLSPDACSENDALHPLRLSGNGYLLDTFTQAALYMGHQLLCDWNSLTGSLGATGVGHEWASFVRNQMLKALNTYVRLLKSRVALGRRSSVARFVDISCLLAQAPSADAGGGQRQRIDEALYTSLKTCQDLLSALLEHGGTEHAEHDAVNVGWLADWDEVAMMDAITRPENSSWPLINP